MANQVAVVTGGTRGIGLAIASLLVKRGLSLALTYNSNDEAASRAKIQLADISKNNGRVLILRGDAGDSATVVTHHEQIHKELGPVSILLNNAGIMQAKSFEEITVKDWNETIRINLSSAFYWCRQVVPEMKEMAFGRIVNISSIAARIFGTLDIRDVP